MNWALVGWVCFGLSVIISVGNFYLSFLRYPLYKLLGWDYHWVSGVPIFGTVTLLIALGLLSQPFVWWSAPVLAALDTAGLPWFFLTVFFAWLTGRG